MGLAGSSEEIHRIIASKLWAGEPRSVIHLDSSTKDVISNDSIQQEFKQKLQVFVVTADSPTTLRQVLNDIKKSRWWNHMAFYLILGWPSLEFKCSSAYEMLWTAWKMDILNAKYLCLDRSTKLEIYSFNPYTTDAPSSWKLVETHRVTNNHPWTLFVRNYRVESAEACRDLDFDKTNNVGGYKVRYLDRSLQDLFRIKKNKKNGRISFDGYQGVIFDTLMRYIKATPKIVLLPGQQLDGTLITESDDNIIYKYATNKTIDIVANYYHISLMDNVSYVYPFLQSGLRVISQFNGYESQLSKIYSVFDYYSRLGLLLVSLSTAIFFKYYLAQSLMHSFLNFCRLICNAALPSLPTKLPARIYLSVIFMFYLIFQGIFQGKLSSLLTKTVHGRNINEMSDLIHGRHTIYGHRRYYNFFGNPSFDGRFVGIDKYNCTKYVLHDSLAACVRDDLLLIYDASGFNLHLSRDFIVNLYFVHAIRDDWPLEQRINTFYERMVKSGLIEYLIKKLTAKPSLALKIRKDMYENQKVKVITLQQLKFIFVIHGIGLALATVSFIVECNIRRIKRLIHRVQQKVLEYINRWTQRWLQLVHHAILQHSDHGNQPVCSLTCISGFYAPTILFFFLIDTLKLERKVYTHPNVRSSI